MQGAKCAISKLIYGSSLCTVNNQSLKLVAYRLVHTDKPYINLIYTYGLFVEIFLLWYYTVYLSSENKLFSKTYVSLHIPEWLFDIYLYTEHYTRYFFKKMLDRNERVNK